MGKATGISSQFRGKVGNVIGYLTKNRAGRYEQSVKAYQPVVANPQSFAQALARVPVGPVQRICSALLPIIQRGFEGVSYGDASKSEFLSYNLKYFRGPYLEKSYPYVVPGPVLLTRGSLASITIPRIFTDGFLTTLKVPANLLDINQISTLSAAILGQNEWIVQGEQLTFVVVLKHGEEYSYRYFSFFVDPNDTRYINGYNFSHYSDGDYMMMYVENIPEDTEVVAGAVIRSQPYGSTSFRRSTTFLTLSPNYPMYNTEDDVRRAVASYRDGDTPEDWEDDPTPEYQKIAYLCMVEVVADMCYNWQSGWAGQYHCLGYMTKGGTAGIFYGQDTETNYTVLLDANAKPLVIQDDPRIVIRYNSSYLYAREYSEAYGVIDTAEE